MGRITSLVWQNVFLKNINNKTILKFRQYQFKTIILTVILQLMIKTSYSIKLHTQKKKVYFIYDSLTCHNIKDNQNINVMLDVAVSILC